MFYRIDPRLMTIRRKVVKQGLTWWKLGRVFCFRSGHLHAAQLRCYWVKLTNLKEKTQPKQLLGSIFLNNALPGYQLLWLVLREMIIWRRLRWVKTGDCVSPGWRRSRLRWVPTRGCVNIKWRRSAFSLGSILQGSPCLRGLRQLSEKGNICQYKALLCLIACLLTQTSAHQILPPVFVYMDVCVFLSV